MVFSNIPIERKFWLVACPGRGHGVGHRDPHIPTPAEMASRFITMAEPGGNIGRRIVRMLVSSHPVICTYHAQAEYLKSRLDLTHLVESMPVLE